MSETTKSGKQKGLFYGLESLTIKQQEDRTMFAGGLVFLIFAGLLSFMAMDGRNSRLMDWFNRELLRPALNLPSNTVYPVLLEQEYAAPVQRPETAALSDVNAGGSGGLTEKYGFHTLSSDDVLQVSYGSAQTGSPQQASAQESSRSQNNRTSDSEATGYQSGTGPSPKSEQAAQNSESDSPARQATTAQQGQSDRAESSLPMRIPANYRFQNDFAMRYDMSASLSIPRRELAGYKYFRDLLRQVRENFAPPGLNLAYRDGAGTVISQPIKPQVVKVLFLIDEEGTVRDTRIVSSMGQQPVDQACLRSLEGHNFGPPPKEIFQHGNIFGISFLFPAVMNR